MNWNWKWAVVAVVVAMLLGGVVIVGGVSLYADHLYRSSYDSSYSYSVSIGANQSLEDLTLYLPVPVNGTEVALVGTNVTVHGDDETAPADAPPVTGSIVDTEYGPMLAIRTDAFAVEPHYYRFVETDGEVRRVEIDESDYDPSNSEMVAYTERAVRIEVSTPSNDSIDTRSPTGREPLLSPELTRTPTDCEPSRFETLECAAVESRAFLAYDAPTETRTSLWVELEGRNEWWVFGWNGNYYTERYVAEFRGPQDGWQPLAGRLESGWGNYRE